MRTKLKIGLAGLLLVTVLVVLFTEGVIIPKQLQPNVLPIRLLSVATTDTGAQAVFELRNESGSRVDVWAAASLNVGTKDRHDMVNTRIDPISIDEDRAARIAVNVPSDKDWQLMIRVARHGAREGTIVFSDWASDSRARGAAPAGGR